MIRLCEFVIIDLVEYLVLNDGYRYVLVVIDNFIKYLELFVFNEGIVVVIVDKLVNEYIFCYGVLE